MVEECGHSASLLSSSPMYYLEIGEGCELGREEGEGALV